MPTKKELIQFVLTNATNCDFTIPMFQNNVPSINATTKYSWDITSQSLACGFGSIVINGNIYNFTFNGTLSGLLSVLNTTSSTIGCGFFCFEVVGGNTFVYVVDDKCVYGTLSLCNSISTSTTTTTTTAPSTSTTTSTTTAPSTTSTTTSTTTAPSTSTTTSTTTAPSTSTTTSTTTAPSTSTTTSTTTAPSTSTTTSTTTAPSTSTTTSTTTAPSTSTTTSTTTLPIGVFSGDVWFGLAPSSGLNNACDNGSPQQFLYWGGVTAAFTIGTTLFTDVSLTTPYPNPSNYIYCRSDGSGGGFDEFNLSGNTLGTATGTIC